MHQWLYSWHWILSSFELGTLIMAKYKLRNFTIDGVAYQDILDKESTPNRAIPKDTANADYAKYLEWVSAGNTPEAAD